MPGSESAESSTVLRYSGSASFTFPRVQVPSFPSYVDGGPDFLTPVDKSFPLVLLGPVCFVTILLQIQHGLFDEVFLVADNTFTIRPHRINGLDLCYHSLSGRCHCQ